MSRDEYSEPRPAGRTRDNELVLADGEFAYIQDKTKGVTQVRTGPVVINLQGQDRPVVFNPRNRRYTEVALSEALQQNVLIKKGDYGILDNPASNGVHPRKASSENAVDLSMGERVHIPGPASIALWPGQSAEVIPGHHLRLNQYLIARVYDETAARENWAQATVQKTTAAETGEGQVEVSAAIIAESVPENLSVGRQFIIRGTEVSFFIPPTGVEVVVDESTGEYVRDALSLERLQYCILIDESGDKRFVQGPDVVFPKPTERFYRDGDGVRIFKPIELSGPIQGIHIKVIQDYEDTQGIHGPAGKSYHEGDELFITGEVCAIYFPCEQHSVIRYDGRSRHYATAIQPGEGRYILNRFSGEIRTQEGGSEGSMVLPDPRGEVFVRRVLTDAECELMYPGNAEVLSYNRALRNLQEKSPTTRSGYVSEGELARGARKRKGGDVLRAGLADVAFESSGAEEVASAAFGNYSNAGASHEAAQDAFSRESTYTQPREITLGANKFAGVPTIAPWTGYAVLVVDPAGNRTVVEGPQRRLLAFDETLESLGLSTGKPKSTDKLVKTSYLQVRNNNVTDVLTVETADHVQIELKLVLRVNFEGEDKIRWFAVTNYVKLLCDHVRSLLKGQVRRSTVEEFYNSSTDIIRNIVLGEKGKDGRPGLSFEQNGMVVSDVDVLNVRIVDPDIANMLQNTQREVVQTNIRLAQRQRELEATRMEEEINRELATAQADTVAHTQQLQIARIARDLEVGLSQIAAKLKTAEESIAVQDATNAARMAETQAQVQRDDLLADAVNKRTKEANDLEITKLRAETEAQVELLQASQSGFAEALVAIDNKDTLVKVAQAMSVSAALADVNSREFLNNVVQGTPLAALLTEVNERASVRPNGARTQVAG